MNNALFTPLRDGGWLPQEAFVYLWHKKIKVMYLEDYQVEDLMKFEQEQTEFYVPQTKYSSTGRAKLIFMVPKGGEYVCKIQEIENEYSDVVPQLSPLKTMPAWLVYNCIQGK